MPPCLCRRRRAPSVTPLAGFALLLYLLSSVAMPTLAIATPVPSEENRKAAKARLERGAELIDADDLKGALVEFEGAYRLVPNPNIFHNFGLVYQGLGRKVEALEAFERFLAEAESPRADTREHAQRAVAALSGQVASLIVSADVPGADILIDGRRRGETPHPRPLYLEPGVHEVVVEEPGSRTVHRERLEARAGQRLTVRAALLSRLLEQMPSERLATAALGPRATPAPAGGIATAPMSTPQPRGWQRPAAWTTAVAGTLALGLAVQQGLAFNSTMNRFNDMNCFADEPPMYGGPKCRPLHDDADDQRTRARVAGIAGGVLGVSSAVLFLTLPSRAGSHPLPAPAPSAATRLRRPPGVALVCAPAALGLGCQGRF